jgi:predicted SprT family Zn-dependent metalloprotease
LAGVGNELQIQYYGVLLYIKVGRFTKLRYLMADSSVIFNNFLYILNISDSIARLVDFDIIHVLDLYKVFLGCC